MNATACLYFLLFCYVRHLIGSSSSAVWGASSKEGVSVAGIGFAKTAEGNWQLIAGLDRVRAQLKGPFHNAPLLVGPSRKGFLGKVTGVPCCCTPFLPASLYLSVLCVLTCMMAAGHEQAKDRDIASAAAAALCVSRGANIVRVHNVAAVRDAVRVADAVARHSGGVSA